MKSDINMMMSTSVEHSYSWLVLILGIISSLLFLGKCRVVTVHAVTLSTYTVNIVTFALKSGTKHVTRHVIAALLKSLPLSSNLLFKTGKVTVYAFTWSSYTVAYVTCVIRDGTKHVTKHMSAALCRSIPLSSKLFYKTGHVTGRVTIYAVTCSTSTVSYMTLAVYNLLVHFPLCLLVKVLQMLLGFICYLIHFFGLWTICKWIIYKIFQMAMAVIQILLRDRHQHSCLQHNTKVALFMRIPFRDLSRLSGKLHTADLPRWLRQFFIHLYVWVYKCKVHEAVVDDLTKYKNLNEFFRRELKPGLRPVDQSCCLTSPADGRVLYQGRVVSGTVEQVKGVTYSLKGFLGPPDWTVATPSVPLNDKGLHENILHNRDNVLYYSIVYLGPQDYHRFHSPADWTITYQRHFPGELFSVNPSVARWLQGLFNFNERAVFYGKWQHGFFSMSAVGATNVGSIKVYFDEDLETNKPDGVNGSYHDKSFRERPVPLKKGENFGEFNIGSTIVLVFEAPPSFQFSVKSGQKVQYGQHFGN